MDIQKLHQSIRNAAEAAYSRSGGPGGQNVNKVNTKVTLRLRLAGLEGLAEAEFHRLTQMLAPRLSAEGEELIVHSSEERSQSVNEEKAFSRLESLIIASARLPKRRRPTKPTRASREKRLKIKKLHGLKKLGRHSRFTP
jgi:ribosome-associated protein